MTVSVLILLLAGAILPQEGAIQGLATDSSDAPLADCQVLLRSVNHDLLRETRSNLGGKFRFEALAPASYEIEVFAPRLERKTVPVTVRPGSVTNVTIVLKVIGPSHEVTVDSEPTGLLLEESANADAQSLDGEQFNLLPSRDRDAVALGGALLGLSGSQAPSIIVDGVERESFDLPASAIDEITINRSPYSAEFSRPGSQRIEIRTRDPKREWRAAGAFFYRNSALDARNAFASRRIPFSQGQTEASLGGPLFGRGDTAFILTLESKDRSRSRPLFAQLPEGLRHGDSLTNSGKLDLDLRVDGRVRATQSYSLRVSSRGDEVRNDGVGGLNLPERARDTVEREREIDLSWSSVLSRRALNQFRAEIEWESDEVSPRVDAPAVLVHGAFSAGGAQQNSRRTEADFKMRDVFAATLGAHSLRMGGDLRSVGMRSRDLSGFGGTFEFTSLDDYLLGRPLYFRYNEGNPNLAFRHTQFSGFLQDEWRLRNNLGLSLGIRYEAQSGFRDRNNFAPRIGLAWSPGKKAVTVVRAGFGIFYERVSRWMIEEALRFDGLRLRQGIIEHPAYPDPFASGGSPNVLPPSVVRLAPDLHAPYLALAGISLERKLPGRTVVTIEYAFQRGLHLFRSRNLNLPAPETRVRPLPDFGNVNQFEASASSLEHTLSSTVRSRWKRVDFAVRYRYQHAWNDTDGRDSLPANPLNIRADWGRADYDTRHSLRLSGTATLPGRFRVGLMGTFRSGAPYTIITGTDDNGDTVLNDRPPGVRRNGAEGPGFAGIDARIGREWTLRSLRGREVKLEAAVEAFNVLNRTNRSGFIGNLRSPFFGTATSADDPRQLQFSARVRF